MEKVKGRKEVEKEEEVEGKKAQIVVREREEKKKEA